MSRLGLSQIHPSAGKMASYNNYVSTISPLIFAGVSKEHLLPLENRFFSKENEYFTRA
jgi:hypothetical protein